jgi:hypothetical protein
MVRNHNLNWKSNEECDIVSQCFQKTITIFHEKLWPVPCNLYTLCSVLYN